METFDEVDFETGKPTGRTVPREEAHRTGLAHVALHLWVFAARDSGPVVLFQKRALHKQTFPGLLDASVGGHLRAGETWREALREAEEEIGLPVDPEKCVEVLRRPFEVRSPGVIDREWLLEYIVVDPRPLSTYRFDDGEVSALAEVGLADMEDLLSGNVDAVKGRVFDGRKVEAKVLQRDAWNPYYLGEGAGVMAQVIEKGRRLIR